MPTEPIKRNDANKMYIFSPLDYKFVLDSRKNFSTEMHRI